MEIARRVCQAFRWRRPNGELRERSCRELLARCDRLGLVRLPPAKPRTPRVAGPEGEASSGPWVWPEESLRLEARRADLHVRPIAASERPAWRQIMQRDHYLGYRPLVGETLCYAAFLDGALVALTGWAAAALRNPARDAYLGWEPGARHEHLHLVVNNVRFLVLPTVRQPNLASQVLGANLRRLAADWQARYGHPVLLAETFVDPARFRGTCYRASNWIEVGQSKGWAKHGSTYRHHGSPKTVFIYPLHRQAQERLRAPEGPRGKEHGMRVARLDLEKLPLDGEGGLVEALRKITDPRKRRGVRHSIVHVLGVAACAVLCGARSFASIAEWATDAPREVLERLGSRRRYPPSEPTIRRVLGRVNAEEADRVLGEWFCQHVGLWGKGLALDGKCVRGSGDGDGRPIHLLSAVLHDEGVVVAQRQVADKTNEIPEVKPLLEDLTLHGVVVTADALHTQKGTARYLVEEKEADYLFTVKGNQPSLLDSIDLLGLTSFSPSA